MHTTITVQELKSRLNSGEPIQLIDVRSPGEYAAGHAPMAMNIPLEQVEQRLPDLKSGQVAILCKSGRRAGIACDVLKDHHENLILVEGGTDAWVQSGGDLVTTVTSKWSLERQVRFGAGILTLTGSLLSVFAAPAWVYLPMFIGAGLTFAGATDICGMALLLAKMPWNKAQACSTTTRTAKVQS